MAERDILKSSLGKTPHCLTPEQLEALLDGKQTNSHLASCPRCQAEFTLLKTFESESPLPDEGAAVGWISAQLARQQENIKNPSRVRSVSTNAKTQASWWATIFGVGAWRWAIPVTAAAVIAGVMLLRTPKEPELQANAGGQPAIYRSQEVELVAPIGDLQRLPQTLQWHAFPGAEIYKVKIMEVDHSPLWTGDSKQTSMEIPAAVRAKMLPGKPILWQVTAVDEHGRVQGSSQIQRFVSPRENSSEKLDRHN